MKDAFKNKLELGDRVIYSVGGGGGTEYVIGTISGLLPHKPRDPLKYKYTPPDRVAIKVQKTTRSTKFAVDPVIYASNVILIESLTKKDKS